MLRDKSHRQEEKERVRLTLLRAALLLSASHGFASLGLREVARAANIAPTSFYRHFADMADIGRTLVAEYVAPLLRELGLAARAGDARATALAQGLLRAAEEQPEVVRFLVAERAGAFAFLRQALDGELQQLASALDAGSPRGELAVAVVLAGLARALDLPASERAGARERLRSMLTVVLDHG